MANNSALHASLSENRSCLETITKVPLNLTNQGAALNTMLRHAFSLLL